MIIYAVICADENGVDCIYSGCTERDAYIFMEGDYQEIYRFCEEQGLEFNAQIGEDFAEITSNIGGKIQIIRWKIIWIDTQINDN